MLREIVPTQVKFHLHFLFTSTFKCFNELQHLFSTFDVVKNDFSVSLKFLTACYSNLWWIALNYLMQAIYHRLLIVP